MHCDEAGAALLLAVIVNTMKHLQPIPVYGENRKYILASDAQVVVCDRTGPFICSWSYCIKNRINLHMAFDSVEEALIILKKLAPEDYKQAMMHLVSNKIK
jgi:hypothetical protein